MRKRVAGIVAFVVVAAFVAGCTGPAEIGIVTGSGVPVSRELDLSGFDRIEVSHGFRLEAVQSESFGVRVETDDNLGQYLRVEVSGRTLRVGLANSPSRPYRQVTLRAWIGLPALTAVEMSGGSTGKLGQFRSAEGLEVTLSGGSILRGEASCGDARLDLSGGSDLELFGSAGDLEIDASGGSKARLAGWKAGDVTVDASGGSQVALSLEGTLTATASGGSIVEYDGAQSVQSDLSGGAQVVRRPASPEPVTQTPEAVPTPSPELATPTPEVFLPLPEEERAFEAARAALATKLGVDPLTIQKLSVEAVDWPNGCLGAPEGREMCTEAIVPGFRVMLEQGGKQYEARTNRDGSAVRLVEQP